MTERILLGGRKRLALNPLSRLAVLVDSDLEFYGISPIQPRSKSMSREFRK